MYRILSIDALGNKLDGYEWNNWYTVGEIETIPDNNDAVIELLIKYDYLIDNAKDLVTVNDDQYNLIICNKETLEPIYAIEYVNEG